VNYSVQGASLLGPCFASFECTDLFNEVAWDKQSEACWDAAELALEPTASVRSFCSSFSEAWFECGFWFPTSECEMTYGMRSDAIMDRLSTCTQISSCDDFESCVQNVFDTT
jgi:hypothetical protein